MQDLGVVLARGIETGRQLQAALQQVQRILVAAQPGGDLGEHADRRHVGRRLLQVSAQQRLGLGNTVLDQRDGGGQQLRVAGGMAHVVGVGGVGGLLLAGGHEVVAERAPCLRQVGLQRHRAAQRVDRLLAAPVMAQRQAEVEMGERPVRLAPGQRLEDLERALRIALPDPCRRQQPQRGGVVRGHLEDLRRLFAGQGRVALQQALRMGQRLLQRADGGRVRHGRHVGGGTAARPAAAGGQCEKGNAACCMRRQQLLKDSLTIYSQIPANGSRHRPGCVHPGRANDRRRRRRRFR